MRYAIQLRTNGSVLDYSDSLEEIQQIMASSSHNLEIVDTTTASVIKVTYTELGGHSHLNKTIVLRLELRVRTRIH